MKTQVLFFIASWFASWILWLPVTFWCGHVFCRAICPLGLSQSLVNLIFHPKTHVRRVCTNLPRSRVQRCVNWALVAVYFLAPCGYWLNPWGLFGRVVFALFLPGVLFFACILVLAIFGKGRFWCNWVCPIGTIFDAVARLGWSSDRIVPRCAHCRRCFT